MDTLGQITAIGASLVAVLVGLAAFWLKVLQPRLEKAAHFLARVDETINGRPAELDSYGRPRSPAIPALAEQQAETQAQMRELTTAVRALVEHTQQLDEVRTIVVDHDRRIGKLEEAYVERVVSRADSALAWRAVEAAVRADGHPDPADAADDVEQPDLD